MIVVIGAGIAGLSVAHALVLRGEKVTVVDAGKVGGGASGVATSYLEPRLGVTAMRKVEWESLARWPDYAAQLENATGIDVDFRTEGQLRVALKENQTKFERDLQTRQAQNWAFQKLTASEVQKCEPALSEHITAGAYLENVRWVAGKKVCDSLAADIRQKGSKVLEGFRVAAVETNGNVANIQTADGSCVSGDKLIVCNGMGANVIEGLPQDTPKSRPVRGVNLIVDQSGLQHPLRHLVKHNRGNLCPRANGQLIVGTTYEPEEVSLEPDAEVVEKLYTNATPILPDLLNLPVIEITAGIRTKVGDGNLWLGQSRESRNVYFSLSHAGAGFLRAPVVGTEFANFILTGERGVLTATATHS